MSFILDPYRFAAAPALTATWSPTYLSAPSVLSGGDLTLTANTGAAGTYANAVSSRNVSDLGYYSFNVSTNSGETVGIGVASITSPPTATLFPEDSENYLGDTTDTLGLWQNSGVFYGGITARAPAPAGNTKSYEIAVRFAPDTPTSTVRVWMREPSGSWLGGGDPVTDTTPTQIILRENTAQVVIGASLTKSGANSSRFAVLHGDAASTTGTPPTGFTAALWGAETV